MEGFVAVFLPVHLFLEGNGRLSRLLTALLLLRAGYGYAPFSSLESVGERSQSAYYRALRRTQAAPLSEAPYWQPWIECFLHALREQQHSLRRQIEREQTPFVRLPAVILRIACDRSWVAVREAAAATGAIRNTVKDTLKTLVVAGALGRHGTGRGSWYPPGCQGARSQHPGPRLGVL